MIPSPLPVSKVVVRSERTTHLFLSSPLRHTPVFVHNTSMSCMFISTTINRSVPASSFDSEDILSRTHLHLLTRAVLFNMESGPSENPAGPALEPLGPYHTQNFPLRPTHYGDRHRVQLKASPQHVRGGRLVVERVEATRRDAIGWGYLIHRSRIPSYDFWGTLKATNHKAIAQLGIDLFDKWGQFREWFIIENIAGDRRQVRCMGEGTGRGRHLSARHDQG